MKPGYIHYKANYKLIVDNLLDFTHLAWVHPTTLGTDSAAGLKPVIERDTDGNGTLTITPTGAWTAQIPAKGRIAASETLAG